MDYDKANLGDRVKCQVTGFEGIVISITLWLNGCVRVGVQPEKLKDGKLQDGVTFDQEQLKVTKRAVHTPNILQTAPAPSAPASRTGGPAREGASHSRFTGVTR